MLDSGAPWVNTARNRWFLQAFYRSRARGIFWHKVLSYQVRSHLLGL